MEDPSEEEKLSDVETGGELEERVQALKKHTAVAGAAEYKTT